MSGRTDGVHRVSRLIRRVVAPNPGLMTGAGTNTYLVGDAEVSVIDPGPDHEGHIRAVERAARPGRIVWILLTHTHSDHAPGAARLGALTGAPVLRFARRDSTPADELLHDREARTGEGYVLRALHTPGHAPNHLCFHLQEERVLFSGDTVLEGTTSVVAPRTGGDMTQYLGSLQRLRTLAPQRIAPGHGTMIDDPRVAIDALLRHRRARGRQIRRIVRRGPVRIAAIVAEIYPDTPEGLLDMAAEQVYSHLIKLRTEGQVVGRGRASSWRAT